MTLERQVLAPKTSEPRPHLSAPLGWLAAATGVATLLGLFALEVATGTMWGGPPAVASIPAAALVSLLIGASLYRGEKRSRDGGGSRRPWALYGVAAAGAIAGAFLGWFLVAAVVLALVAGVVQLVG